MNMKKIFVAIVATVFATIVVMFSLGAGIAAEGGSGNAPAPLILDKLPPTWSQIIPGERRFELVLNGEAVLDKETGLVWQQTVWRSRLTWESARVQCIESEVGGRLGWHLPTVEQMASLLDRNGDDMNLPVGHPFDNVGGRYPYWTATPYPGAPCCAYSVDLSTGELSGYPYEGEIHVWCVRGGQSNTDQ
jgi:hypothetical protein